MKLKKNYQLDNIIKPEVLRLSLFIETDLYIYILYLYIGSEKLS